MEFRYHSDASSFYNSEGHIYPEPKETLEDLEALLAETTQKLKSLPPSKPASEYSDDGEDLFLDLDMARFNLCSYIENLEWKIDLKLFYAKSRLSD